MDIWVTPSGTKWDATRNLGPRRPPDGRWRQRGWTLGGRSVRTEVAVEQVEAKRGKASEGRSKGRHGQIALLTFEISGLVSQNFVVCRRDGDWKRGVDGVETYMSHWAQRSAAMRRRSR